MLKPSWKAVLYAEADIFLKLVKNFKDIQVLSNALKCKQRLHKINERQKISTCQKNRCQKYPHTYVPTF